MRKNYEDSVRVPNDYGGFITIKQEDIIRHFGSTQKLPPFEEIRPDIMEKLKKDIFFNYQKENNPELHAKYAAYLNKSTPKPPVI